MEVNTEDHKVLDLFVYNAVTDLSKCKSCLKTLKGERIYNLKRHIILNSNSGLLFS